LRDFTIVLPDEEALREVLARLDEAKQPLELVGSAVLACDPAGNTLRLAVEPL
jgi:hypothetical protein